jgi:hypothetical protein
MSEIDKPTPKVGNWVRYRWNGRLVIGVVAYIVERPPYYPWKPILHTDIGQVDADDVLECR